jgi:hypothetical protein
MASWRLLWVVMTPVEVAPSANGLLLYVSPPTPLRAGRGGIMPHLSRKWSARAQRLVHRRSARRTNEVEDRPYQHFRKDDGALPSGEKELLLHPA